MPKVSVVIPTYNRAYLLKKAIYSILKQTYQDFEIIVVDDGSTDNTKQAVKDFNDNRIIYIRHNENSGSCYAPRNTGNKFARGEYIANQDDDSEWLPDKLERQIKAFEKAPEKVGVVYTGMWFVGDNKKIYSPPHEVLHKEGNIYKELFKGNFVWNPNALIKKECFHKVGMYDEKLVFWGVWDMWLRISKYYDFKFIDEPLAINYWTATGLATDPNIVARGWKLFLQKHFQEFKDNDIKSLAKHYYNAGMFLCLNNDINKFDEGRKFIQKALTIYPLNLRYIIFNFLSLFGPALFHNSDIRKLYLKIKRF